MNAIKQVATMLIKNYANSEKLSKQEVELKDLMYGRVSSIIELAKLNQLDISNKRDKFLIHKLYDPKGLEHKPITIYKNQLYCEDITTFFYGLKRSNKPIGYLAYYKHINNKKFIEITNNEGCCNTRVINNKEYTKAIKVNNPQKQYAELV